jgi:N,N-dimethylformamidase
MTKPLSSAALYGYASGFSVAPGDAITFHVSGEGITRYRAQLVRLRHGLDRSDGPGLRETEIASSIDGDYAAQQQPDTSGSYVEVDDPARLLSGRSALSLSLTVYATLVDGALQGLIGSWDCEDSVGYALVLEQGRLALWIGDGHRRTAVKMDVSLEPHTWYAVSAGFDLEHGLAWVEQTPVGARGDRVLAAANVAVAGRAEAKAPQADVSSRAPFRIAALSRPRPDGWAATAHFNGKLGNPRVSTDATTLAAWDFARSDREDRCLLRHVADTSANGLHGMCLNAPTRGVTGAAWDGIADDFQRDPASYGAIHFHEDDLDDARWPVAFELVIGDDVRSGVYAIRLRAEGAEEHIPFFVRPGPRQPRSPVLLLMPTGSYLAYANDRLPFDAAGAELLAGHVPVLHRDDLQLQQHYDFGRSCYELHPDGSGVIFSSRRRPIINMRPRYLGWFMAEGPWQFPADLCVVDWLDHLGIDYDVATDEDLDRDGYGLLAPYQAVLTGSHPEYVSQHELDAVERYVSERGRLMYLGGNGFYWLVTYDPERPYLMEVRRSENGSRPHEAWPGEHHHQTSGERCGLWRSKRRAPQRLLGVGYGSEGFDRSSGYDRMPDSFDPAVSFIFDGVDETRFGEFGFMGGGAAGAELDRYDIELGSPPEALLLATSAGMHSDDYQQESADLMETPPTTGGTQNVAVRSDVVYVPLDSGGAVFSVGSIAWTGALSHNGYDNSIARITENVLRRFLSDETLPRRTVP